MRKLLFASLMTIVAVITASCGGSSPSTDIPEGMELVHGEFSVRITQEFIGVDAKDCNIVYAFSGGDGISDGIYDAVTGEDMGMAFVLSGEQTRKTQLSYRTGKTGVFLMFAVKMIMQNGAEGMVNVTMDFYLDGKPLGTETAAMTGEYGPVTFGSDKWVNKE